MIVRNNAIGVEEVSSSAVSKEYLVSLTAGGDTQNTDCLNVQGLPRISVQVQSRDNTAQVVSIIVQGAIAQEGANPRYFNLNPQMALLMSTNNYVYSNYDIALQYVRVVLETTAGVSADVFVRVCASQ
jgi:hypothetical protein